MMNVIKEKVVKNMDQQLTRRIDLLKKINVYLSWKNRKKIKGIKSVSNRGDIGY